jgi:DnaJ-class molecular chaperone
VKESTSPLSLFGLSSPFTSDQLKSSFRRLAKQLHTDTSGGDTKEAFVLMKAAYDKLVPLACSTNNSTSQKFTDDGIPLSELGLGLGPTKNGRDCEYCEHRGYLFRRETETDYTRRCALCGGIGLVNKFGRLTSCPNCLGLGPLRSTKPAKTYYATCYKCMGSGETEVFNPAFPKGALG